MVKRYTASQLKSKLRQNQMKQKQAISKFNQAVRQYNTNVTRAVNNYNSEVRKHNARVRANRQRVISELNRLQSRTNARYSALRASSLALNRSYQALDTREEYFESLSWGAEFLDLSERESANSLAVSNALEADDRDTVVVRPSRAIDSKITNELSRFSPDLHSRWEGALYSLNPDNPDAARHFCISAREVFIQIIDSHAPNEAVLSRFPNCEMHDEQVPTRRSKIRYILTAGGIVSDEAVDFVDANVENVLELFRIFNDGAHGHAGRFKYEKLIAIKDRVENGIQYLTTICGYVKRDAA